MDKCINPVKAYQFAEELKKTLEKSIEENLHELKSGLSESNMFEHLEHLQVFENALVLVEDLDGLLSRINIQDGEITDNEILELIKYIEDAKYLPDETKQEFKEFIAEEQGFQIKPCSISPISFNTFRTTSIYSTMEVNKTSQPNQVTKAYLDTSKINFKDQPEKDTFQKKVDLNNINDIASKKPDLYSYIKNIQSYAQRICDASSTSEVLSLIRNISWEKDKLSRELNA